MSEDSQSNTANGSGDNSGNVSITEFMSHDKISAALWLTRMVTIVSTFMFFIPIMGNGDVWYQRAMLSSAATSALRLHQRVRERFQLSRAGLAILLQEDTCHYLIFSICFLSIGPVTIALLPIFLFAVLHSTAYCRKLLTLPSVGGGPMAVRSLLTKIEENTQFILRFIALNEILLMPVIILLVFRGASSLFLPFIYYRFLALRYASIRNPHCRNAFYELRCSGESFANHPSCPGFVRSLLDKSVSLISRLAPEQGAF
jgi:transmembrane protein 33